MLKTEIIGNLGKDAEINNVNGKSVINFTVAHTDRYKDKAGNKQEKTTWVTCALWVENSNIAQYLKKGTQVYVEGTPEAKAFTANGKPVASLNLTVKNIQLLGGGQKQDGKQQERQANSDYVNQNKQKVTTNYDVNNNDDSGLPF